MDYSKMHFRMLNINEIRTAYFLKAFGRSEENMLILSFGKCNYKCPYCKRNGRFINENNEIIYSRTYSWSEIRTAIDTAIKNGLRICLSCGEPSLFKQESFFLARYIMETYQIKIGLTHNGSSPKFVRLMAPYLEYLILDVNGSNNAEINYRIGMIEFDILSKIIECIEIAEDNSILTEIRTCIFKDTSIESLNTIASLIHSNSAFWTLYQYNEVANCSFEEPSLSYMGCCANRIKKGKSLSIGYHSKWDAQGFTII